jgi:predicted NAD/FAD-binding protein
VAVWRTVQGGAVEYVSRIGFSLAGRIRDRTEAVRVERNDNGAAVVSAQGERCYQTCQQLPGRNLV